MNLTERQRRIVRGTITWLLLTVMALGLSLSSTAVTLLLTSRPGIQMSDFAAQGQLFPVATSLCFGAIVKLLGTSHNAGLEGRIGIGGIALVIAVAALLWFVVNLVLLAVGHKVILAEEVVSWSVAFAVIAVVCGETAVVLYEWEKSEK